MVNLQIFNFISAPYSLNTLCLFLLQDVAIKADLLSHLTKDEHQMITLDCFLHKWISTVCCINNAQA